ncbi:YadA-like family protein [Enterobacter cloacae subsp. cloacae]|nr:YadA-like family protein [Enterobacter cloacae subsp. cloacae]
MVSAGAGTFMISAVAVGASFHAGEHAIVKAGVTTTTNNDYAVGAGIGLGW